MIVTESVVVPSTDSIDEASGINATDDLLEVSLNPVAWLAPALVVNDLSIIISVCLDCKRRFKYPPRTRLMGGSCAH
jgi:hypothetical protein